MIETSTITAMAIAGVYCTLLPIVLLIVWKCRTHTKLFPFFVGAGIFILFAMVLENLLHQVCLLSDNALSRAIRGSVILTMLYGGFAAGIFEETGRFVAFKLMKRRNDRETAITYGIGHGGIESILLIGVTLLLYVFYAVTFNQGGLPALTAIAGDDATASMLLTSMQATPVSNYFISAWERSYSVVLHIALSVLVFSAVHTPGKRWLFPVAILIHAGVDCFAMLYQVGVMNLLLTEILAMLFTVCTAVFAYRVYQKIPASGQEEPLC